MTPVDTFEIYGWMKIYYRQVAETAGFFAKDTEQRWTTLRKHMLADNPPNDPTRADAIDGVRKEERAEVLTWLEIRRRESLESN